MLVDIDPGIDVGRFEQALKSANRIKEKIVFFFMLNKSS
jgi:hypothetical protein